ncbi:ABC transporter substrate-binding protein [Frankia sp. QA3]|uniref:ABC transporter substrate-binding protein n=1 Tax=Frankia sp. QA3 TaxID=710111 RepID=UPI000269CEA8|nr:ABC transporter substrate-binding protein [Frankia sp. QA3]EIV96231.1 ABC-type dipeptide transport system, periplasmic component [Frankia sp. QA3]
MAEFSTNPIDISVNPTTRAPTTEHPVRALLTRRGLFAGAGAGGLAAFLAACGSSTSDGDPGTAATSGTGGGKRGGVITLGAPPPPTALDPVTMYDGTAIALVQLVADYLIWLDPDFRLQPRLATAWASSDGGRTWSFTLRKGVVFSDGTPLDAATVKASFDRLLDPANKSSALSAFDTVLKAGGVSASGANTVVFRLERPFSDFPYLVSAGNYNSAVLKADYKVGTFPQKPIGTGPFLLTSYNVGTGASFTRNPKYWDAGKPYLEGVKVTFRKDAQADLLALQSGAIDGQILSQADLVIPLAGSNSIAVDKVGGTGVTVLTLRVDKPPFTRKEVRQAVAYALDRPGVLTSVYNGIGVLGNDHLIAPAFPAAPTDLPQRAKDAAKVTSLLSAAGIDHLRFTLSFDVPNKSYALVIQDQLKRVGITVDLDQQPSDKFYGGNQDTDTPWLFTTANLVGWAGRPTPSQFIIPMVKSHGVWNGSKYANPALDAAANAYDAATDPAERKKQAGIIARALNEDVPIIVNVWNGAARAYRSDRIKGLRSHPSGFLDLTTVTRA